MPDMYRSPALEPFVDYVYMDSMTSRTPPVGSIPRGYMTYPFENTNDGFEMAGEKLKNPYKPTDKILKEGQVLYTSFCAHCHGAKGDGAGSIVNPIYGGVPSYASDVPNRRGNRAMKDLKGGHIYHTIMYGLNAMGPHATLIREEDRWKIVSYVQTLQGKPSVDSTGVQQEQTAGNSEEAAVVNEISKDTTAKN